MSCGYGLGVYDGAVVTVDDVEIVDLLLDGNEVDVDESEMSIPEMLPE